MDGPGRQGGDFSTCEQDFNSGFEVEEYDHDFFGGRVWPDVLNSPTTYLGEGDWVSDAKAGDPANYYPRFKP